MARHFEELLRSALAEPHRALASLPMMAPGEREKILRDWNRTDSPFDAEHSLHGLFERQARHSPRAIALVTPEAQLTYEELDARANALSQRLVAAGVACERVVAILMDRTADLIVAM